MDLSLEPPSSHALMDVVLRELRDMAAMFRDRDFSNDDCAAELEEWIASVEESGKNND